MTKNMITQAMLKFLRQVDTTGSTAGKHALVTAAEKRGYIERDRVVNDRVLFRLTEAGRLALPPQAGEELNNPAFTELFRLNRI